MSYFILSHPCRGVPSRSVSPFMSRAAVAAVCAVLALPALAGRPLATDDAAIVESGACQIELWRDYRRDAHATWLNPGCNPFGSTEFAFGLARIRSDDAARLDLRQWQVKQMLRAHDDEQTGFALALGGQRTRHTDARDVFVHGIATLPLAGEAHVLHVNLGALRAHEDRRHRNRATWGLAYDAEVAAATRASLETLGVSGERARWQFGLRHEWLPGRVQIDASIGSGLGRWNDDRLLTVGLVFVSPPFLR